MARYRLGVDLGGTKILAGLFDEGFSLVGRAKQRQHFDPPELDRGTGVNTNETKSGLNSKTPRQPGANPRW